MSADTTIEYKLTKLFDEKVKTDDEIFENGDIIFSNIIEKTKKRLKNFTLTSLAKRAEILDSAILKIEELFAFGVKPSDITIITPLQDDMLRFTSK